MSEEVRRSSEGEDCASPEGGWRITRCVRAKMEGSRRYLFAQHVLSVMGELAHYEGHVSNTHSAGADGAGPRWMLNFRVESARHLPRMERKGADPYAIAWYAVAQNLARGLGTCAPYLVAPTRHV
jgi:hypothetical protein